MKRLFSLLIFSTLFFSLIAVPVSGVRAVEDSTGDNSSTEQERKEPTEAEKKALEQQKKLQERIDQHKKELQEKLKDVNENRIKTRCKAAQGLVSQTNERTGIQGAERTKRYEEIQKKITNIISRLKAANIDTAQIEQQQSELAAKVSKLKTDIASYKQTLSDLKEMDCSADPTGFKAALEAARIARDDLIKQIADIKSYLKDTVKPTLQELKAKLEQQEN